MCLRVFFLDLLRAEFGQKYNGFSYDYNYDTDYFDSPSFSATTTTTPATTTTPCPKIDCKIELFSKTLFRGDKIEVTADMEELGDFDNKVQSIKVSGTCSWKVFVDESNQGVFQTFMPGEYRNAATIKLVLKKASSVQNIGC